MEQPIDPTTDYVSLYGALIVLERDDTERMTELASRAMTILNREQKLTFMVDLMDYCTPIDGDGDFEQIDVILRSLPIPDSSTFPQELAESVVRDVCERICAYEFCVTALLRSFPEIDKKILREVATECNNQDVVSLLEVKDDV